MSSKSGPEKIFNEIEGVLSENEAKFDSSNNARKERKLTQHEVNVGNIAMEREGLSAANTIDIHWESIAERDPTTMEANVFEEASIHHTVGRVTLMFIFRREQDKPVIGKKFTLVEEAGLKEIPYDDSTDFLTQQKVDQQFDAILGNTDMEAIDETEMLALRSLLKSLKDS